MSGLTEFLLARLAEDEHTAKLVGADAMVGHLWKHWPREAYEQMQAAALRESRRVLAEVEAKRRIVALLAWNEQGEEIVLDALNEVAALLASVYADHPDYDPAWRSD